MKQMLRALLVISCVAGMGFVADTILSALNPNLAQAAPRDP